MANIGHDTDERRKNAIALLDADLHGLLQVKEVDEVLQAKLSVAKVRSISRMSTVADDRAGMRKFCTEVLTLDDTRDIVEIASLVDTWESATTRVSVRNKAEAEAGVANLPRALNKVEIQELLVRFQKVHGVKLEDRTTPAAMTLEQIFDQVEQGELKNMSLVQFLSRDDAEADILGATVEKSTGALKIKKGYGECQKPRNPEEFRKRMSVVANAYLLAQLKYPQKASLRDLQPQHFLRYLDLMLGEHVLGLKARNKDGEVIATPDFDLMLSYDYQVRRQMVKLVNEGATMAEGLKEAMTDTTIKERHFLTPNVYSQVTSTASSARGGDYQRSRQSAMAERHMGCKLLRAAQRKGERQERWQRQEQEGPPDARSHTRRSSNLLEVEQPEREVQVSVRPATCLSTMLREPPGACVRRLRAEQRYGRGSGRCWQECLKHHQGGGRLTPSRGGQHNERHTHLQGAVFVQWCTAEGFGGHLSTRTSNRHWHRIRVAQH